MAKNKQELILKLNIDEIERMIIDGYTHREMARHFGVHLYDLSQFLADERHSARARAAHIASADMYAEKAEQVLIEATWKKQGQDFDLKKARELAQHYRWMAAKRNPRKYSEKIEQSSQLLDKDGNPTDPNKITYKVTVIGNK